MVTIEKVEYALQDILERNSRQIDPYCPWCGAEDFGVDEDGNPTDDDAAWYEIEHEENCAVTLIESVLSGDYRYLNQPNSLAIPTEEKAVDFHVNSEGVIP